MHFSNIKETKKEQLKANIDTYSYTYRWVALHKNWGMKVSELLYFAVCHAQILISVD